MAYTTQVFIACMIPVGMLLVALPLSALIAYVLDKREGL